MWRNKKKEEKKSELYLSTTNWPILTRNKYSIYSIDFIEKIFFIIKLILKNHIE